jgi:hypothetical protein
VALALVYFPGVVLMYEVVVCFYDFAVLCAMIQPTYRCTYLMFV